MGSKKVYDFNNIVVESFNEPAVSRGADVKKGGMFPGLILFYIFFNSPVVFFFGVISLIVFSIIRRAQAARRDLIRKYVSVMIRKPRWTAKEIAACVGVYESRAVQDLTMLFDEGIINVAPESYAYAYDADFINRQSEVDEDSFSFSVDDVHESAPKKTKGRKKKSDDDGIDLKRPEKGTENAELFDKVFDYIKRIKKANDRIPDEQFTAEINEIEKIATQIYSGAMQRPKVMGDMRKFVNYYLPTTLKLLESYAELNERSIVTPAMNDTMDNIRNALKDIKEAFYKMYENIFSYTSMDISTEIGALENVLMSEGLLKDGLTLKTDEPVPEVEEEEVTVGGEK